MAFLRSIVAERTDLGDAEADVVQSVVAGWSLIADLAMADLVLWLPTWNESGFVAAAQVRPATAATSVPEDVIGSFIPRGRRPVVDAALRSSRSSIDGSLVAVAVPGAAGRRIGVVERRPGVATAPTPVNAEVAELLLGMVADGMFPGPGPIVDATSDQPRVGDGTIRLDAAGRVEHASPNAVSTFHRLGLATPLGGTDLARTALRLSHRPGPVDEGLALVAGGRVGGGAEIANARATATIRSIPLVRHRVPVGALILVRDVTDLRERERALLSKDAALREVHHRVKNNLQTVSALLRLQARRVVAPEAAAALGEAGRRVAAIAAVHEVLASEPGTTIDVEVVIDRLIQLTRDLAPAHSRARPLVIEREGAIGVIPTDVASPLAMALSELLANAVEHADAARIRVEVGRLPPGCDGGADAGAPLRVVVRDDGVGIDPAAEPGLGRQIITMLIVEDLGGEVEWGPQHPGISEERPGTRVEMTIPMTR